MSSATKSFLKLSILVLLCLAMSCKSKKKATESNEKQPRTETEKSSEVSNSSKESFETFNRKFHNDRSFQMSRINFPLEGVFVDGVENHKWNKDNWEFIQAEVSENPKSEEFEHSLIKTDDMVVEKYWIEDAGFKIERHFKLKNGKWYLVYYDDINM